MKHINFFNTAPLFLALAISSIFVSCAEENELPSGMELIIPEQAYSFQISSVSSDTETNVFVSPSFNDGAFEGLGCKVKKIDYFIDNQLVESKTNAPFDLTYKTALMQYGKHELKAIIVIGGDCFKDAVVEYNNTFNVASGTVEPMCSFYFDYPHFLRLGDTFKVTPELINNQNKTVDIHSVEYYWENELVKQTETAPYILEFNPTLEINKSYSLKIRIKYDVNGQANTYFYTSTISVLQDDETRSLNVFKDSRTNYSNGDKIEGLANVYLGKGDKKSYEFNLYLDDKIICTSKQFAYTYSYVINGITPGIHTLKSEWVTIDGPATSKTISTRYITIDK